MLQPVLVRPLPGRHLRADRRRAPLARRAARRARASSRRSCAPHDDAESLEVALIENMAREDLNPVEEARACSLLVEELGLTREEVGRRVGRSRVAVSNLLRLLDLPDEVLDLLVEGRLTEGHGRALLMAPDHADRRRLARAAAAGGLVGARDRGARAARTAAAPRPARRDGRAATLHPDQVEAAAPARRRARPRARRRRPRHATRGRLHASCFDSPIRTPRPGARLGAVEAPARPMRPLSFAAAAGD